MANITQLKLYYTKLNSVERSEFMQQVTEKAGCAVRTVYDWLYNEPAKPQKKILAEISQININDLYKTL
jgi:DNA-binding phage protein